MKTIYKYEISMVPEQVIHMPKGSEILSIQRQHYGLMLWALVDPDQEPEPVKFRFIGTGEDIENSFTGSYIGTYKFYHDSVVLHLFRC